MVKITYDLENSNIKVMAKVKPIGYIWGLVFKSICLLFVSWQSDQFWWRYSKFHIWPWKFKVKVMAKVNSDGHIWGLEFIRCVCFTFRGNGTILGWDIANSIFDLENSRSRSWPRSNPMLTFEILSHYLVDPYTWPWSPNGQDHIWPWKFKYQGHGQGQTHWLHLRPSVQINMFAFHFMAIAPFWLRYSQFHIWPWKFKVNVMAKVKSNGHIWGLEFSRCVCFSFSGNGTILDWV